MTYRPSDDWVAEERRHGKAETYWRGCRCDRCKAAHAAYNAGQDATPRRRHGTTPHVPCATERDIGELYRRAMLNR